MLQFFIVIMGKVDNVCNIS